MSITLNRSEYRFNSLSRCRLIARAMAKLRHPILGLPANDPILLQLENVIWITGLPHCSVPPSREAGFPQAGWLPAFLQPSGRFGEIAMTAQGRQLPLV